MVTLLEKQMVAVAVLYTKQQRGLVKKAKTLKVD
jgi:hypothetical protein